MMGRGCGADDEMGVLLHGGGVWRRHGGRCAMIYEVGVA